MGYRHGVYTSEAATSLAAPVLGTAGLQVIIGTAPVNMVADPAKVTNVPVIAYSYKEAVEAMGFSDDFEKYTLCEAIAVNFQLIGTGPIVMINVLDPANTNHKTAMTGGTITIANGIAKVNETGILVDNSFTVKKNENTTLTKGTDYATAFNADGTLNIIILDTTATTGITSVIVSGNKLDPTAVTASDIVGGVNISTGAETGLEVVRQVRPKFALTPGILLAPRFSKNATVAAALQAKCLELNGVFRVTCIIDIDSGSSGARKYTDVKTQKDAQGASSNNALAVWPFGAVGDVIYSGSALAGALTVATDAANNDVPNTSPSNKNLPITAAVLEDGTEVLLDLEQANTVNGFGVATFLKVEGFRLWGNNTAAYPGTTDPKDRWFAVRRFFSWTGNTFMLTYFDKVDSPGNTRLIQAIVDSENIRGNGFVANEVCARYEITYNVDENSATDLMDGTIRFHQYLTPYTPAEKIENVLEFDPSALAAALTA